MFLKILIIAIFILAAVFIITQILTPAFTNHPFFPMFRKKRRLIEGELAEQSENDELEELAKHIKHEEVKNENANNE